MTLNQMKSGVFGLAAALATFRWANSDSLVVFASACHRQLDTLIGISDSAACALMMILPGLYFALGWLNKRLKRRLRP
jgi:hypothetical protein